MCLAPSCRAEKLYVTLITLLGLDYVMSCCHVTIRLWFTSSAVRPSCTQEHKPPTSLCVWHFVPTGSSYSSHSSDTHSCYLGKTSPSTVWKSHMEIRCIRARQPSGFQVTRTARRFFFSLSIKRRRRTGNHPHVYCCSGLAADGAPALSRHDASGLNSALWRRLTQDNQANKAAHCVHHLK